MGFFDSLGRKIKNTYGDFDRKIGNAYDTFDRKVGEADDATGNIARDSGGAVAGATIAGVPTLLLTQNPFLAAQAASQGAQIGASIQGQTAQKRSDRRTRDKQQQIENEVNQERKRQAILSILQSKSLPREIDRSLPGGPDLLVERTVGGLGSLGASLTSKKAAEALFGDDLFRTGLNSRIKSRTPIGASDIPNVDIA